MAAPAIGAVVNGLLKAQQGIEATSAVLGQVNKDVGLLTSMLKKLTGNWLEVNDAAFKTARTMALGREQALQYNKQLLVATKELAAQFGVTAKELADFQQSYSEAVGRNVTLSREQLAHMSVMSKIAGESASKLVDEFDKVGVGVARAAAYTGRLQDRAKALGVSPAKATKMMADNIKLAASYSFRNGVNDIEKMSLRAASMRMDMQSIMNATEKFADIEGAISTSANIQMLGGSFAREFSNPMGAMYEAMADPAAFQERVLRTIEGKGRYDAKTGAVTFDPITMRMMREMAKQLGMSAEDLNKSAMASVQNQKVEDELKAKGTYDKWAKSPEMLEAIKNLSRTNIDEQTGEHYITVLEDGEEKQVKISELTEKQLEIATDNQLTQEGLWSDVQDIKTILERVHGRARETVSTKEQLEGVSEWWGAFRGDLFNGILSSLSTGLNQTIVPFISTQYPQFARGGLVKPIHAAMGANIVPGTSYYGDRVPVMANSGEMILNQGQQKGLFDLLKNVALTGAMAYGGSKLGKHFGVGGVGTNMALTSLLSGGNMGVGGLIGSGIGSLITGKMLRRNMPMAGMGGPITLMNPTVMMNGQAIMNGDIGGGSLVDGLVDSLGEAADAARETSRATRGFSTRLMSLARKRTLMGSITRGLLHADRSRRRLGAKISNGWAGHFYRNRVADAKVGKAFVADWWSNTKLAKGAKNFRTDVKSLFSSPAVEQEVAATTSEKPMSAKQKRLSKRKSAKALKNLKDVKKSNAIAKTANSAAKATTEATKAVSKVGTAGKVLGGLGKAGKFLGKAAGPLGAVMAVGSAIGDISAASSQYDARVDEIERSGMSERDKARAKDRAAKEKNASYGGSVGSAVGATAGAALGSVLGPLGMMAGGWLGSKAGEFLGKGIGGLFGGGNEKKFEEEQEKKFKSDEKSLKSGEDVVNLLKSIDGKLGTITKVGIHGAELKSPSIASIGLKGAEIGLSAMPKIGTVAKLVSKFPVVEYFKDAVKALPDSSSFLRVEPSKQGEAQTAPVKLGKTDINLNVSGTIKLEGNGKSVDFDISKLLDTPDFKRQLAEIIQKEARSMNNAGKDKKESDSGKINTWSWG